ncbi:unnamed protein product [Rhodiola kirilowii]
MEFRTRNYSAEREAASLPRHPANNHPLSTSSSPFHQVDVKDIRPDDFTDPLRENDACPDNTYNVSKDLLATKSFSAYPGKEWESFKKLLMQKFPDPKMVPISQASEDIIRKQKIHEKSASGTSNELDDPLKFGDADVKVITRQEYIAHLQKLKDDISRAWHDDDRFTSLKLCTKVARLLMDTSVTHFYPTLFVMATDIMDMLGDMVWGRIKYISENAEDQIVTCTLTDSIDPTTICNDARETCINWFCKIASIQELLPRIYLELALLPCWSFLVKQPADNLQRLKMMTRGLADPVASAYCHLYMAHCAEKFPRYDAGEILVAGINNVKILLMQQQICKSTLENKKMIVSLVEPAIEYLVKRIFEGIHQGTLANVLVELGLGRSTTEFFTSTPYVPIVLYHVLRELPVEVVSSNAVDILHLIDCSNDYTFDLCLNYRLLGLRLCEKMPHVSILTALLNKVKDVLNNYDDLDGYLIIMDAYLELVLPHHMDNYLNAMMEGIYKRTQVKKMTEEELTNLQSIFVKLISNFEEDLEGIFALNHFLELLGLMHGSPQIAVSMHVLSIATRNSSISNPSTIQQLFEISQSLHNSLASANANAHTSQQASYLISHFVQKVDYGRMIERHLAFLIECRTVFGFGHIHEVQESLIRSSNALAIKGNKGARKNPSFAKSCISFSEVTISGVLVWSSQMRLYLETAEVALLVGLVSHSEELISAGISCLQSFDSTNGAKPNEVDDVLFSLILKLFSILVLVPGNTEQGVASIQISILDLVNTASWITPIMKSRIVCAIIVLSSTLTQNKLPYHVPDLESFRNDILFFGNQCYVKELVLLSDMALQNLIGFVEQEPSRAARGTMALDACNSIALSFKMNSELYKVCERLMEIARSCLGERSNYLQNTSSYLGRTCPLPLH